MKHCIGEACDDGGGGRIKANMAGFGMTCHQSFRIIILYFGLVEYLRAWNRIFFLDHENWACAVGNVWWVAAKSDLASSLSEGRFQLMWVVPKFESNPIEFW